MSQFKLSILSQLCSEAQKSLIDQQLSAVILKGTKMVSKPLCNSQRNTCRGSSCGSLHAEANAIINYFGPALIFNRNKGWCFLPRKWKKVFKT